MKNVFFLTIFLFGYSFANGQNDVLNDFTDYTDTALNLNIEMIAVQGGAFTMGCTAEQGDDCSDSEKPARQVTVSDFYIGKYEVTQAQWKAVMGTTVQQQRDMTHPDATIQGEGDHYPMYYVNWNEVQEFISRLNAATGKNYRLPAEAEWEFAARGGNSSRGYKYSGSHTADEVAWYFENSNSNAYPVGAKAPNELGIYDMSGNLSEYCSDWFYKDGVAAQRNPQGSASVSSRVHRGGNWYSDEKGARVSCRNSYETLQRYANIGFRLVCSLKNDTVGLKTNVQNAEDIVNGATSQGYSSPLMGGVSVRANPIQIMHKSWELNDNGHCDSLITLLNEHINLLQEEDYDYGSALNLLSRCYEKLEMIDSAEQTMLREFDYVKTKYGIQSRTYSSCLARMTDFYDKQQNRDKLLECWRLQLNPERYDLRNKNGQSSYEVDFETVFMQCRDYFSGSIFGIPSDQVVPFEEAMKYIVQDSDFCLNLLQNKMNKLIVVESDKEREESQRESQRELARSDLLAKSDEYATNEEYAKAVELLTANFDIFQPGSTQYYGALRRLSNCYIKLGETDPAETILIRLKDENDRQYGKQSFEYESAVSNLIAFYQDNANLTQELELRLLRHYENNYKYSYDYLRERHRIEEIFRQIEDYDRYLAFLDTQVAYYLKNKHEYRYISEMYYIHDHYYETEDDEKAIQTGNQLMDFITSHHLESQYKYDYEQIMERIAYLYLYYFVGDEDGSVFISDLEQKVIDACTGLIKYYEKQQSKEIHDRAKVIEFLEYLYDTYHDVLKDYENAEKTAIQIVEKIKLYYGKNCVEYGEALERLASVYFTQNDYNRAIELLTEAKTLKSVFLDANDGAFAYIWVLELLGDIKLVTGKKEEAESEFAESQYFWHEILYYYLLALSTQARQKLWDLYAPRVNIGCQLAYRYNTPWMYKMSYDGELLSKGLLLRTANAIRSAVLASNDQSLIANWEELSRLREQIEHTGTNEDSDEETLNNLTEKARILDREITQASAGYRDLKADLTMTWQEVQQQLKPDEAAIEFINFRLHDQQWEYNDTTIYAALVLRPDMEAPAWIPLCEEKDLQAYFDRTKGALNDKQKTNRLYNIFGAELYSLVWQPLEKELEGVGRIYYAPSGLLHKVPFDAIPVDGARLFDRYEMKLVSSTREIKRLKEEKAEVAQGSAVLYGGIVYEADADSLIIAAKPYPQSAATRSFNSETRGSAWKYLDGSEIEMEQIATYLQSHQVDHQTFTGVAGNEESFKNLSGNQTQQIVISTHGFFLEDIQKDNNAELIRRLGGGAQKPLENPLLRSGLVLAGGNRVWTGQPPIEGIEDGILTADEISQLNLLNTRLVVLSACQTGLGEVQNSEGVFGLQRAFKLAGVESLIMSLWEVDDKATQIMMSAFYENWLGGKTKQEAFRIAQKAVRENTENDFSSPYYWAAFVMMD